MLLRSFLFFVVTSMTCWLIFDKIFRNFKRISEIFQKINRIFKHFVRKLISDLEFGHQYNKT